MVTRTLPVATALVLSIVLRTGTAIFSARLAPVAEFGIYATVNATSSFIAILAMGGWPSYALAIVPKYGVDKSFIRRMNRWLAYSCAGLILFQSAFIIVGIERGVSSTWSVVLAATTLLVGTVFATAYNEVQRASGNIIRSRFAIAVIPPVVAAALIGASSLAGFQVSATVLLAANGLAWACLWFFAQGALKKVVAPITGEVRWVSRRDLMITKISQAVLSSMDVIAVGSLLGPRPGALYAVASRLATAAGIGYTAVVMAYGPAVSKAANSRRELVRISRRMTLLGVAFTVPVALGAALLGELLLNLFGSQYTKALPILYVLLTGVSVNAICGPIGLVANVTHQEGKARRTLLGTAVIFVAVLPLAVLQFGSMGAAALWALATLTWNIALLLQLRIVDVEGKDGAAP